MFKNKAAQPQIKKGDKMSEVNDYKCPSCGAPMYYDIKQKIVSLVISGWKGLERDAGDYHKNQAAGENSCGCFLYSLTVAAI